MITIIKIMLLLISLFGWALFFHHNNAPIEFAPIIAISFISIAILFTGYLFNILFISYVIYVLGFIFFIIFIKKHISKRMIIIFSLFVLSTFLISLKVRNLCFIESDNFTHWAPAVKTLFTTNRLPNNDSQFIIFQSYPLGSTIWAYYFCLFTKYSEPMCMVAQFLISLSCLLTLFSAVHKNKLNSILIIIFSLLSLTINIQINSLYVDTIIPLLSLAILIMLLNDKEKNINIGVYFVSIFLCQVKQTGIFFFLLSLLLYCFYSFVQKKAINKKVFLVFAFSLLSIFSWKLYIEHAYVDALSSKHSISLEYVSSILKSKSWSEILEIGSLLVSKILMNTKDKYGFVFVLLIICFYIVTSYFSSDFSKRNILYISLSVLAIYFIYFIGLYLMEIFFMPNNEAMAMFSIERYMYSITILCIGIITYFLVNMSFNYKLLIIVISLIFSLLLNSKSSLSSLARKNNLNDNRYSFINMIKPYDPSPNKKYLIIDTYLSIYEYGSVSWYSMRYDLWSNNLHIVSSQEEQEQIEKTELYRWEDYYDYLIINTPTDITNYYLSSSKYKEFYNIPFTMIASK